MRTQHGFRSKHATDSYARNRSFWDTPLFESDNFVAVPSVGALVEGWVLVVPRIHALSCADIPFEHHSEFVDFVESIVSVIEERYGCVSLFEHGPARLGTSIGCGVDYAHLHLVPNQIALLRGAQDEGPNIFWTEVSGIGGLWKHDFPNGYWFLQQDYRRPEAYVGTVSQNSSHPSQLFRRVIAKKIGEPDNFDWKRDCKANNVIATVAALSAHPATEPMASYVNR